MSIYRIPVSQDGVRTFKDPNGDTSRRTVYALVRLADLPEFPLNPDPRVPKKGSKVLKTIYDSACSNNGKFHSLNRGITLSVKSTEFDSKSGELIIEIPENETEGLYGVIDGGHTQTAIRKAVQDALRYSVPDHEVFPNQVVKLEIMVGIESDLADIARARNFSAPLKDWGLEGYRGKFEWLLDSLGSYAQHLRIRENEEQPVPIMDVIQVLCALNPRLHPDDDPAVEAYVNAGKCLENFVAEGDPWEFRRMAAITLDILKLYDYIRFYWDDKYNGRDETGRRGRIDLRKEMGERQRGRRSMLTFYFLENTPKIKDEGFPVEKAFALPVMSACRALIKAGSNDLDHWVYDPFAFFDENGTRLIRTVMGYSAEARDAHVVGRNRRVYTELYGMVEKSMLVLEVERLRKEVRGQ